ncbi:MAG: ABC transporter ATP-binding protein [Clostridia bacterium]|nr:ABC transporter ATP-binding protein [Clostridia bacterium]
MKSKKSNIKIMTQLAGLVKPMLLIIAIAVVLGVLGFLCASSIPVLGALGIAKIIGADIPLTLKNIFILMTVSAVLRGVLHYGEQASNHYIAFKLLAIIRSKVFGALRNLCPAKLEGNDKGNLIALITSDIELLEVFYAHTISPAAIGFITSLAFVIFISSISPILGIIAAIAYITIGIILPSANGKAVKQPGLDYRNSSGELNNLFLDGLRGMGELIQYDAVENTKNNISQKTESLAELQNKLKDREIKTRNRTETAITLFNIVMILTAFYMYSNNIISFSNALIAAITLMSSYGSVIALSSLSNNLAQTLASGERVLNILEEKPETEEVINGKNIIAENVVCNNVKFAYDKKQILKGISLNIEKGKITGILGESGCGKSTLLKLIMRFWDKDSGKILLSGEEIKNINTHSLRQNESYCTQETHLFNDTIGNNIRIAKLNATEEEVIFSAKQASIHDFITELPLGYDTNIGELGGRLSGGEKQRIGLARAFLSNAPIMLLDEPTSNLDSLNEGIILKSLYESKDKKTIILVSHRHSTLSIADKTYHIKKR